MPYSQELALKQLGYYLSDYYETNSPALTDHELRQNYPCLAQSVTIYNLNFLIDLIYTRSTDPTSSDHDKLSISIRFVQATDQTVHKNCHKGNQPKRVRQTLGLELTELAVEFGRAIKTRK